MTPVTVSNAPAIDLELNFSFRKITEIGTAKRGEVDPSRAEIGAPMSLTVYVYRRLFLWIFAMANSSRVL
jgi:hypothetical protein